MGRNVQLTPCDIPALAVTRSYLECGRAMHPRQLITQRNGPESSGVAHEDNAAMEEQPGAAYQQLIDAYAATDRQRGEDPCWPA